MLTWFSSFFTATITDTPWLHPVKLYFSTVFRGSIFWVYTLGTGTRLSSPPSISHTVLSHNTTHSSYETRYRVTFVSSPKGISFSSCSYSGHPIIRFFHGKNMKQMHKLFFFANHCLSGRINSLWLTIQIAPHTWSENKVMLGLFHWVFYYCSYLD